MSLLDKHSDYTKRAGQWQRARDVVEGQDAVHARGESYLPKLDQQDDDQYSSYKTRARFFNASERTVQGMTGLVSRKKVLVDPNETELENDVTHSATSLSEYAVELLTEILTTGRGGTLVDFPRTGEAVTVAEAEQMNMTPKWAFYSAENIFNWSFEYINNRYQAVYVFLLEDVEQDTSDGVEEYHYRELILEDGIYKQRIYKGQGEEGEPELVEEIIPQINNNPFNFIPFYFHGVSIKQHAVDKPPLLDLFDTNLKHYQLKADHAHALHYVALPTPYVTGVDSDNAPTTIGPQRIWAIANEQASAGILEFTGQGVSAIVSELESMETHMAQLGSRMLAPESNTAETATATAIKSMSENSVLAGIVKRINKELTRIWNLSLEWYGTPDADAQVQMNLDFLPNILSGQDLLALVSSWQSGAFSKETLFENLQRGEIHSDDTTFEEEEEKIEQEEPAVGGFSAFGNEEEEEEEVA